MEWKNIKDKKLNVEYGEFIITHIDSEGVKTSCGAWWNGSEFEDWSGNVINNVEWYHEYPEPHNF